MYENKFNKYLISIVIVLAASNVFAGFLEMPNINEVPEYENESLLLDLDIPNVRERDPDPDSGPRLNVQEFRVQGLFEFPELGINKKDIIKRVEDIRFEMMEEDKLLDSGYTQEEIAQVADLIAEIEDETKDEHVGPLEVQRLVFLIREQRRSRGVTLGMIETVADTITQYYRERGFILAKAYIPKQHVRDGVVNLTLLLGELGEVNIENNKVYKDKTIKNVFKRSMGEPVTLKRIEEDLYYLNDMPGISAQGFFQPGSQVGDTKLNINVAAEDRISFGVRIDNHGSAKTGEYRLYNDVTLNNPLNYGDQLQFSLLNTFSPSDSTYWSLRYGGPLFSPRYTFSLGYSTNDFVSAAGSDDGQTSRINILGESTVQDASLKYQLRRSRKRNSAVRLEYSSVETVLAFDTGSSRSSDLNFDTLVDSFGVGFQFDALNEKKRILHVFDGVVKKNKVKESFFTGTAGEEDPFIVSFDYTRLSFVNTPLQKKPARLILAAKGQYSGGRLSSVSQFALAGPKRARGYNVNRAFADDAFLASADLVYGTTWLDDKTIFGKKLKKPIQAFLFSDAAFGIEYDDSIDDGSGIVGFDAETYLANIGAGLKFSHGSLKSNLIVASPVKTKIETQTNTDEDSLNVYFDLQYTF